MTQSTPEELILADLNERQRAAATHGRGPLLVIAGAGTGKTTTLVRRVAYQILHGVHPRRILLLTFSRRAAADMLRRVEQLFDALGRQAKTGGATSGKLQSSVVGGTFHAVAAQILRRHGASIGLSPGFTIHDRSDSEDLLDVVRSELDLGSTHRRFPRKGTCLEIYSRAVNSGTPLDELLAKAYPWCEEYTPELKRLFDRYVELKLASATLDYDDLLLYWQAILEEPEVAAEIRSRFDCFLVDEYQDTNALQASIVQGLAPQGDGLTVVGDDAQSIYSFRAATVRNILDFPKAFPGTTVVKLEQNYRSTPEILTATNAVIALATERHEKQLWSARTSGGKPQLVCCTDEEKQSTFVSKTVLEHYEQGTPLRRQAVLFRTAHHALMLEAELATRNIPFVKYGGLKFLETAHIKDVLAFLRLAENPGDIVAAQRVLLLLPGVGPKKAQKLIEDLQTGAGDFEAAWGSKSISSATNAYWPEFVAMLTGLRGPACGGPPAQLHRVRTFYQPLLELRYDSPQGRVRDLEQLEHVAARFEDRATMLADLTLDPPNSTSDLADDALLDEDYLILSTIHSAKGLEWENVFVISAADGNIPSDMTAGDDEAMEEERRLFYVALTRAIQRLYVVYPQRHYRHRFGASDAHVYGQPTRFLPPDIRRHFEFCTEKSAHTPEQQQAASQAAASKLQAKLRNMWK